MNEAAACDPGTRSDQKFTDPHKLTLAGSRNWERGHV